MAVDPISGKPGKAAGEVLDPRAKLGLVARNLEKGMLKY